MKHWLILIIFGMRHQERTYANDCSFGHLAFATLPCEMQKS